MSKLSWLAVPVLTAVLASGGCDNGAPPASASTAQAQVKGAVSYKGKPLGKITVAFNPANVNRKSAPTATAKAADDGTYELTTLAGENTISLVGGPAAKNGALTYFSRAVELKPGNNTVNIDIP